MSPPRHVMSAGESVTMGEINPNGRHKVAVSYTSCSEVCSVESGCYVELGCLEASSVVPTTRPGGGGGGVARLSSSSLWCLLLYVGNRVT